MEDRGGQENYGQPRMIESGVERAKVCNYPWAIDLHRVVDCWGGRSSFCPGCVLLECNFKHISLPLFWEFSIQ